MLLLEIPSQKAGPKSFIFRQIDCTIAIFSKTFVITKSQLEQEQNPQDFGET